MSDFEEAFEALKGLTNYETMARPPYGRRAMNLPRTRALLAKLDHPERSYPILQVAGTKGKGTAATALAHVLGEGGRRVGLFTSPHLFHVRERIRADGAWITEEAFARGVDEILRHVAPLRGTSRCPTFFEMITVLALLEFRRSGADAVVLEVGLGGRLDATSAVRPLASLITSIGRDHTTILGRTRARIAEEKAGVAKRGVPLVSGVPPASPAGRAISRVAAGKGAPLLAVGRDFRVRTGPPRLREGTGTTPVTVITGWGRRISARTPLLGRALARDAGLAAALLLVPRVRRKLDVDEAVIEAALATLRVPGRMDLLGGSPPVLVDGAHNPGSVRALLETLGTVFPHQRSPLVVLGGGVDKYVDGAASLLRARYPGVRLIFTKPRTHPRAADPRVLAKRHPRSRWRETLSEAMDLAQKTAGRKGLVLVTGSLYLAGEALALLGRTELPTSSRCPSG